MVDETGLVKADTVEYTAGPLETSPSTGKISKALCAAQAMMPTAKKDAENPFYKSTYSTLGMVMEACRGPLTANGIAVIQGGGRVNGSVAVPTRLTHESGEWVQTTLYCIPKDGTAQSIGACITYLRRFGLAAMAGVASEDDDGNGASGRAVTGPAHAVVPPKPTGGDMNEAADLFAEDPQPKDDGNKEPTEQSVYTTVHEIMKKEGKTGDRKWTLYGLKCGDGLTYNTFDDNIAAAAQTAINSEESVNIWWVPNKKYPSSRDAVGVEPGPAKETA